MVNLVRSLIMLFGLLLSSNSFAFLPFAFMGAGSGTVGKGDIVSDKPLFDPAKGIWLKAGVDRLAAVEGTAGQPKIKGQRVAAFRIPNQPPTAAAYLLVRSKGRYRSEAFPGSGAKQDTKMFFAALSDAPFDGRPFSIHRSQWDKIYIAQIENKSADKEEYTYRYFVVAGQVLAYNRNNSKFKPENLDRSKWNGSIENDRIRVTDVHSLHFMLDERDKSRGVSGLLHQRSTNRFRTTKVFHYSPEIPAARAEVMSALCLFLAESPFDPGRQRGVRDHAVPGKLIDTGQAWPACNAALEAGTDSLSVRYSAARVMNAMAAANQDEALSERAKAMLVALRDEGFALAESALALRHFGVPGQERDAEAGKQALWQSADNGNATAAYLLGQGFRMRWLKGITADEAERYLRQAIEGGIIEAYGELGLILQAARSPDAAAKAVAIFTAGAKAGDPESRLQLGLAQYKAKTHKAAYENFKLAAEAGLPHALYMEGFMRLYGQGTGQSDVLARNSFEKAVKLGHTASKAELGMILCTGKAGYTSARKRADGLAMLKEAEAAGAGNAKRYLQKCE